MAGTLGNILNEINKNPELCDFIWLYILLNMILESPAIISEDHEAMSREIIARINRRFEDEQ